MPATAPPRLAPSTATPAGPAVVFSFVSPTDAPTATPSPVPNVAATAAAQGTPFPTSASANTLGNTPADAALVGILQSCWGVADLRDLNASIPEHRAAFNCARASLLGMAQTYPAYADVHRVLAWGYFYTDSDIARAVDEYRAAANLYRQAGDKAGESEARMRLGLLLVGSDRTRGCAELGAAADLNPQNSRASQYYSAYQCGRSVATGPSGGGGGSAAGGGTVDIQALKGKILFKSDRTDGLYVVDPDGQNMKAVGDFRAFDTAMQFEAFSPDRTKVAGVRLEGFDKQFGGDNNDIWVTDPQGGSGRALANPHNDYDPAWSPVALFDGRQWLAFVSNRGDIQHPDAKGDNLWLMHDDGTSPIRLTCYADYRFAKHPSFSPDGKSLVFYSDVTGRPQLHVLDLTRIGKVSESCEIGASARPLLAPPATGGDYDPVWVK